MNNVCAKPHISESANFFNWLDKFLHLGMWSIDNIQGKKTLFIHTVLIKNYICCVSKWAPFNGSFILYLVYFRKEKPSLIFEILQRLSELKRFDMAVMFMSEPEKKRKFCEESFSISQFCIVLLIFKQMIQQTFIECLLCPSTYNYI